MDRLQKIRARHLAEIEAEYAAIVSDAILAVQKLATKKNRPFGLEGGKFFRLTEIMTKINLRNTPGNREIVWREMKKRGFKHQSCTIEMPNVEGERPAACGRSARP